MQTGPILTVTAAREPRFGQCTYLVDDGREAVAIDPGYAAGDLVREARARGVHLVAILATHGHFDHVAGVAALQEALGPVPFHLHPADARTLATAPTFTRLMKLPAFVLPAAPEPLADGETLALGLRVLHRPGHTPGGCVFEAAGQLFTGDLLLPGEDERLALPGADRAARAASVASLRASFPPETTVWPGHGRPRTLQELAVASGYAA